MNTNKKTTIIIFAVVAALAVLVMYRPMKSNAQDDRQRWEQVTKELRRIAKEAGDKGERPNSREDYKSYMAEASELQERNPGLTIPENNE
jgi:lipopolysaccharide/colanic/teichoic acid biosynthesis glycosyltransferase